MKHLAIGGHIKHFYCHESMYKTIVGMISKVKMISVA